MTHKHTKSNRCVYEKYKGKTRNVNNEASFIVVSKPLLLSSEDDESLAIHSARARMVLQTKRTRFLRKYTQIGENINLINGATYHVSPVTASIIPTYQSSIYNVHWNPYMETCLEEPQFTAIRENSMYHHTECIEPYLQTGNIRLANKEITSFKDNIVRYSDNSTMIWTMKEVGCGIKNPIAQNCTAKLYESTTNLTTKDSYTLTSRVHQSPIIETSGYERNVYNVDKIDDNADLTSNNHDDYKKMSKLNVKMASDIPHIHSQFRRFPKLSTKTLSMTKLSKVPNSLAERCKMSIPHTHRAHSKYHCGCASVSSSHNVNDSIKRQNSRNILNPIQCKRTPSIRLPKRVVASERDVNVFIEKCK